MNTPDVILVVILASAWFVQLGNVDRERPPTTSGGVLASLALTVLMIWLVVIG